MSHRLSSLTRPAFIALLLTQAAAQAASVEVTFCVSFEMLEQTPYEVVSGDSGCASVTVIADGALPGQTVTASGSDSYWGAVGGVNVTGTTVTITERYSWNYSINVIAGPNETASGYVSSEELGLYFDFGSDSYSQTYTWQLEDGIAADGFYGLFVYGEASQTAPVPLPPTAGLLMAGLGLFSRYRKSADSTARM